MSYVTALDTWAPYRLVLIDAREEPHDRAAYAWPVNIADILTVIDHLGIARATFWGYSMGVASHRRLVQWRCR